MPKWRSRQMQANSAHYNAENLEMLITKKTTLPTQRHLIHHTHNHRPNRARIKSQNLPRPVPLVQHQHRVTSPASNFPALKPRGDPLSPRPQDHPENSKTPPDPVHTTGPGVEPFSKPAPIALRQSSKHKRCEINV